VILFIYLCSLELHASPTNSWHAVKK